MVHCCVWRSNAEEEVIIMLYISYKTSSEGSRIYNTLELGFGWHHCHRSDSSRELPGTWKLFLGFRISLYVRRLQFNMFICIISKYNSLFCTLPCPEWQCPILPLAAPRLRFCCKKYQMKQEVKGFLLYSDVTKYQMKQEVKSFLLLILRCYKISDETWKLKIPAGPWMILYTFLITLELLLVWLQYFCQERMKKEKDKGSLKFSPPVDNDHHRPCSPSQTPSSCTRHRCIHSDGDLFKLLSYSFVSGSVLVGHGLHYPTCRQGANASFLPNPSKPPSQHYSWTPVQRQEPDILRVSKLHSIIQRLALK